MDIAAGFDIFGQPIWTYYAAAAVLVMPVVRIFMRAGFNPAWAMLLLVPVIGYIVCAGMLALRKWPSAKAGPLEASPGKYQP